MPVSLTIHKLDKKQNILNVNSQEQTKILFIINRIIQRKLVLLQLG